MLKKNHQIYFKKYFPYWFLMLGLMMFSNSMILGIMQLFGNSTSLPENEQLIRSTFQTAPFYIYFSSVIIAPIMEELVFRIEAILRRVRGKKNKENSVYQIGRFTFDTQKQLLTIGDKQTKLTTKENELLALLCSHANEILQRDFALKTIWIDDNYFNARSMDVYITKLRKHLKDDDQIEIINIHGKGYKLITPEQE